MAPPKSNLRFLKGFINNPKETGSLIPSSATLAREMFRGLSPKELRLIVEYGPGTGVLTRAAIRTAQAGADLILIEKNPDFAALISQRFPEYTTILDDAQYVVKILDKKAGKVDLVFSGLPFTNFPRPLTRHILTETNKVLRPGGHFRTFIYLHNVLLPKISWFREQLEQTFDRVDTFTVYRNFPPALIFDCSKEPEKKSKE